MDQFNPTSLNPSAMLRARALPFKINFGLFLQKPTFSCGKKNYKRKENVKRFKNTLFFQIAEMDAIVNGQKANLVHLTYGEI